MKIRVMLAVFACKLCRWLLRLLGRGGTDFPGRVALKICPNLLRVLAKDVTTVIVTGTNGKTTTARMIEQALADSGISYFANRSGANLLTGVAAEYAIHSTLTGKCKYDYALIESDEAALKHIAKFVDPRVILVTNVFRDQLDRYGDVTQTLANIRIGIENSKNAVVCVNADDSLCATLRDSVPNEIAFYGVNTPLYKERVAELSDAPFCVKCKHAYEYSYVTYGHLGGYRCPNCGYERPQPRVAVNKLLKSDTDHSEILLKTENGEYTANVNLPGGYNVYNACSAFCVADVLGLDMTVVADSLSHFSCGFGRMEKFSVGDTELRMILIKNPAGCNQVLNFLSDIQEDFVFAICLTDKPSDGQDVSWIWDVDFEKIATMEHLKDVYFSGTRADEMAMRFYYAGVESERMHVILDYDALTDALTAQKLPVFVMPTYTGMLDLRATMSKKYGFKAFWE